MQIVYKAADITEAHIIKGLLESHGIAAHIGGFYLQGGIGDLAAHDFAKVHVADEDQRHAIEIISEYEGTSSSSPKKSTTKETTVFYKTVLTILTSILIMAVLSIIIL